MLHLLPGIIEYWWPIVVGILILIAISDRYGYVVANHCAMGFILVDMIWSVLVRREYAAVPVMGVFLWILHRDLPDLAKRDAQRKAWKER